MGDRCPVCRLPIDPVERREMVYSLFSPRERNRVATSQQCAECGLYSTSLLRARAKEAEACGAGSV